MLASIADQMPTVHVETANYPSVFFPSEDIDTHRMLSHTALKIARIDEPLCFQERYDEHEGHFWGHLDVVYHRDHNIRWNEICEAMEYDLVTDGLSYFEPKDCWNGSLRLDTRCFRVNFTPTVRR